MKRPSSNEVAYIAYHEAGHVVADYYVGWQVGEIYIISILGNYGGVSARLDEHDKRTHLLDISLDEYKSLSSSVKHDLISVLLDMAFVLIAGQSAENIYTNKPLSSLEDFTHYGSQNNKTDVVKLQVIESQLRNYLNYELDFQTMISKCNELIKGNWEVVKALAEALLSSEGLGIDQAQIELLVSDLKQP